METNRYGQFGPLIGIVYVSNTHCKFLIYRTHNAEVLAEHELKIRQIIHSAGWLEYDPAEIWNYTQECIENACKNLIALEINLNDIVAVGVCNHRGTTMLWDTETGSPLHNAIGWTDCRTAPLLRTIMHNVKHNFDYLRQNSGQPLSTCFSALKIKWLQKHNKSAALAIAKKKCAFGNLDAWILYNLTGSHISGVHSTDVTNAAFTGLMNIHTLQWDDKLCEFYRIPMHILPRIRSNSEIYGYVIGGPLNGLPIASVISDQPGTILGQFCYNKGDTVCTIDDNCFVSMNTLTQLCESNNSLVTSVAYKLGPNVATHYALEGALSNAGSAIQWLKEGLRIDTEVNSNDNVVDILSTFLGESSIMTSSCSSSMLNLECGLAAKRCEITFVPAFHGFYAPYWRYDARGILLGLTSQTTAENVTQAAFEATGFQIHECLVALKKDTPQWEYRNSKKEKLIFSGAYAEDTTFVQFISDIVGCLLEHPQTQSPSSLGAMIAAGITMNLVSLKYAKEMYKPPSDCFTPTTTDNRRALLYKRWQYAVQKCLKWNNYETYESDLIIFAKRELDTNRYIRRSIPGSIFLTSTFVLLLVANYLQGHSLN